MKKTAIILPSLMLSRDLAYRINDYEQHVLKMERTDFDLAEIHHIVVDMVIGIVDEKGLWQNRTDKWLETLEQKMGWFESDLKDKVSSDFYSLVLDVAWVNVQYLVHPHIKSKYDIWDVRCDRSGQIVVVYSGDYRIMEWERLTGQVSEEEEDVNQQCLMIIEHEAGKARAEAEQLLERSKNFKSTIFQFS